MTGWDFLLLLAAYFAATLLVCCDRDDPGRVWAWLAGWLTRNVVAVTAAVLDD